MNIYEMIEKKLESYLIKNMGFQSYKGMLIKRIKPSEYLLADNAIELTLAGKAFGGDISYLKMAIVENYIADRIEDKYENFLDLTEEEKDFLDGEDEDGVCGTDVISEWIWDTLEVSVNDKEFENYIAVYTNKAA